MNDPIVKQFKPHPVMPQQEREKPMRVLCLGLSRTSTMSLYFALRKLGFTSYHYVEAALDNANGSLASWDEAIQAKYFGKGKPYKGKHFEKMLWRYDAVTDIPTVLFVDELLEAYPDAKVVLTTRDVEPWLASMERSFYEILSWKRWAPLEYLDRAHVHYHIPTLRNALRVWTGDDWENRQKLKQGFVEHYSHVRKVVPKEKLLEFTPKQGWEPLCAHLGVPVPDEPYPRVNEGDFAANLQYIVFYHRSVTVLVKFTAYVAPVFAAYAAWVWYQRRI